MKKAFAAVALLVALVAGMTGIAGGGREAAAAPPPSVSLSPTSGTVGTTVTVTGQNFTANEALMVIFKVPGDPVVADTKSDASGKVSVTFKVPFGISGLYDVVVTDKDWECDVTVQFIILAGMATPTPTNTPVPPTPAPPTPTSTPQPPAPAPTNTPVIAVQTPAPPSSGNSGPFSDDTTKNMAAIVVGLAALGGGFLFIGANARRRGRHTVTFHRGAPPSAGSVSNISATTAGSFGTLPVRGAIESSVRTPARAAARPAKPERSPFGTLMVIAAGAVAVAGGIVAALAGSRSKR